MPLLCLILLLIAAHAAISSEYLSPVRVAIEKLCKEGDIHGAYEEFCSIQNDAQAYHSCAALQLILYANINEAVSLHKLGKATDFTTIPPLAKRHLDGQDCAGLGDLFYVSAVIIKELVDTNKAEHNILKAMKTLVTLTSDSGLHHAAERSMDLALSLDPTDPSLLFRAAVMTPGVYESMNHINSTRNLLVERINRISDPTAGYTLTGLDEFTMSPTFYFVYQGHNDKEVLTRLQEAYVQAHPKLGFNHILDNVDNKLYYHQYNTMLRDATAAPADATTAATKSRKIRVGFVSSHFRRHSICKLFCGVMTHLNPDIFDVYAFSSLQQNREDSVTQDLRSSSVNYVPIGMTFVQNRNEVTDRAIDILVYLDVGMDPSTSAWAAARLAPVQMVIWGHPSTTGYHSIDFYLSSEKFHRHGHVNININSSLSAAGAGAAGMDRARNISFAHEYFAEQLVLFDKLGFYFERPSLEASLSGVNLEVLSSVSVDERAKIMDIQNHLPEIYRPKSYYKKLRVTLKKAKSLGAMQLRELISAKINNNNTIALCPQHLPKFHPHFDMIITGILLRSPRTLIALIDNRQKLQWRRTLMARWKKELVLRIAECDSSSIRANTVPGLGSKREPWCSAEDKIGLTEESQADAEDQADLILSRIRWVSSLTPQEYLTLLAVGDVMLDPFPFGGGVTTLESIAVCTPVITLPSAQSVPQLAAGMLYEMKLSKSLQEFLIPDSAQKYLDNTLLMLRGPSRLQEQGLAHIEPTFNMTNVRREVCAHAQTLYANTVIMRDWDLFLEQSMSTLM